MKSDILKKMRESAIRRRNGEKNVAIAKALGISPSLVSHYVSKMGRIIENRKRDGAPHVELEVMFEDWIKEEELWEQKAAEYAALKPVTHLIPIKVRLSEKDYLGHKKAHEEWVKKVTWKRLFLSLRDPEIQDLTETLSLDDNKKEHAAIEDALNVLRSGGLARRHTAKRLCSLLHIDEQRVDGKFVYTPIPFESDVHPVTEEGVQTMVRTLEYLGYGVTPPIEP